MVALAADIFGASRQDVPDPDDQQVLANFYLQNSDIFATRMTAALEVLRGRPEVDISRLVLMGYGLGGAGVLQYALGPWGYDNVAAMISFHPILGFLPEFPEIFDSKLLVLSGGQTSEEIADLARILDDAEADWEITRYSDADQGFTTWDDGE